MAPDLTDPDDVEAITAMNNGGQILEALKNNPSAKKRCNELSRILGGLPFISRKPCWIKSLVAEIPVSVDEDAVEAAAREFGI